MKMITSDQELETTLERIASFQRQVASLRKTETNPANYRAAVSGFLAEIDRMQLEVREYFSSLPSDSARRLTPVGEMPRIRWNAVLQSGPRFQRP